MKQRFTLLSGFFVGVIAVAGLQAAPVSAAEEKPTSDTYNYVAQPGDSYSEMARKAVQTYGINTNTNLSLGQILFVETSMTSKAGLPTLMIGEKVVIKKETVRSLVDEAKKLSPEAKQAWEQYVPYVEFNTDRVGNA